MGLFLNTVLTVGLSYVAYVGSKFYRKLDFGKDVTYTENCSRLEVPPSPRDLAVYKDYVIVS